MIPANHLLYPTPEMVAMARDLLRSEYTMGEYLHPAVRANCKQVLKFASEIEREKAGGIWTMNDAEFQEELRKAREDAFDFGFTTCANEHTKQRKDPSYPIMRHNPYAT